MGNCQAVDNASLVLQTQTGKSERFYSPVSAAEIMKLHPGHCVALLLTTTLYSPPPPPPPATTTTTTINHPITNLFGSPASSFSAPPTIFFSAMLTDSSPTKVIKGLKAKKNGKSDNYKSFLQPPESAGKDHEAKPNCEAASGTNHQLGKVKTHQHQVAINPAAPAKSKPPSRSKLPKPGRGWHPSLNSISEATS
ncbi:hypothetical protein SSX86_013810 [Deinandra increscens subsp. villosa]|uniref:Uncharacterized protein n=1 Tax=Deinandra increscens subsp. villosa TaxID=3103831 RepID=A0AAP0D581_9ASTR